jgi:hypothetical protein
MLGMVAIAIALAMYFVLANKQIPSGYVKAVNYQKPVADQTTCDAVVPGCGNRSMGKIIDDQCYVPKDSQFAKQPSTVPQSTTPADGGSCLSVDCGNYHSNNNYLLFYDK